MIVPESTLELLLPEADEAQRAHARRMTSALRLLVDDARSAHAHVVGVDLTRARRELELQSRGQLEATLRDLLRLHLDAALPADSFLSLGEPTANAQRSWSVLEELRSTHEGLPGVPEPGEGALAVATRLLAALETHGAQALRGGADLELELWRARFLRVERGPREGELAFRALLEEPRGASSVAGQLSALAGAVECLLDRGAVREARQLLLDRMPRLGATPRLRVLLAWARLGLDDAAGARSVLVGSRPWAGAIPAQLVDLRERRREWLPMLTGRARTHAPPTDPRPLHGASALDRGEFGASVLAVFAFRPGSPARRIAHDVAPGLRSRVGAWSAEHDGLFSVPGTLQHRLLVEARPTEESLDGPRANLGLLGRETTCSAFLEPVLDDEGEVAGWIHAEFEHHLLPSRARRAALAAEWAVRIWRSRSAALSSEEGREAADAAEPAPCRADGPIARAFEAVVERLNFKTQQRLWWGFQVRGGEPELVAQGGQGQGFPERTWGRRRALARALGATGPVLYEEADERLSVHAGAGAGLVLLLRVCGRVTGLLVVESSRRRDFRPADLERLQTAADRHALLHRVGELREWHALRFGHDLWFDAERADFAEFAARLIRAARSHGPIALAGPRGSGRRVLARWVHFESGRESQVHHTVGPARLASRAHVQAELLRARGGTLVVEDLDALTAEVQDEWARVLEESALDPGSDGEPAPRLVFLVPEALAACAAAGRVREDLARRLERLQLVVPALRERREDVLPLVELLARRFAADERLPVPAFTEDALALLWRQPWEGNVRELENLVFKLVLFAREVGAGPGRSLDAEAVVELARRNGVELLRKLPARHPARRDLLAALRATRTRGGRSNKTRASHLLGWDTDTLTARLEEAGLGDADLDSELPWTGGVEAPRSGAGASPGPTPE